METVTKHRPPKAPRAVREVQCPDCHEVLRGGLKKHRTTDKCKSETLRMQFHSRGFGLSGQQVSTSSLATALVLYKYLDPNYKRQPYDYDGEWPKVVAVGLTAWSAPSYGRGGGRRRQVHRGVYGRQAEKLAPQYAEWFAVFCLCLVAEVDPERIAALTALSMLSDKPVHSECLNLLCEDNRMILLRALDAWDRAVADGVSTDVCGDLSKILLTEARSLDRDTRVGWLSA